ncbi:MAG: aldehyde dehydrogenase [Planctomycetes bacterium]|nr:aldehyde dehydrogenase [Planctomycetota bacterium]
MLHIPVLRRGQPYESAERAEILHHATGELVALVSQANSGMVRRDILRMRDDVLEAFTVADLIEMSRKAAELFCSADLPLGDPDGETQSFNAYIEQLSATTGMPVTYCRRNAEKIRKVLDEMETVVGGLTRGLELEILDRGYGEREGHMLSFFRAGRIFGAVLPSNSPGVHSLWVPAIAFKAPVVLKPGREEPWTPLRIIEAFAAAGVPREAFGFYPTDHAGAGELLRSVDRSMLFGGGATVRPYENDPRVEVHGPGYSKIVLGDDCADDWEKHLDLMASSIAANGGRSCINASGVWTPRHGRAIAEALAKRLAKVEALPADDPKAEIAAFNNPGVAEAISATIDRDLSVQGAIDLTEQTRGSPRLVRRGRCAWLLPTIVWCEDREHPLANREFLFPYAAVVECPTADFLDAIGPSLIVSALTADPELSAALMRSPIVDRLNIGPIPTYQISWDQPHEGNLFEHLYRQRAFQKEPAA